MSSVIKIENLSKAYQLGTIGTGTISRDLERYWARVSGKDDPYLKIGETNDRATKGTSDIVWSLKDINLEIAQGDAVGIIGRNGAGKSTLLKILSRVTTPTTGTVKVRGRIASLLEVGTGFHPELTGRENIYLNGAILGMRKKEITHKLEQIVDFAGIERYLDTPVKRYSSGMYVRLAFAVAAHLESEILIVDEVLAVGDAEFQKKCLGKMGEVSKGEGRTVLFVSHNMGSVQQLCNTGILLETGKVLAKDDIDICAKKYLTNFDLKSVYEGNGIIKAANVSVSNATITSQSSVKIGLTFETDYALSNMIFGFSIKDELGVPIITLNNRHYKDYHVKFRNITGGKFLISLKDIPLLDGDYYIDIFLGDKVSDIAVLDSCLSFSIKNNTTTHTPFPINKHLNKLAVTNISWELVQE